MTYNKLTSSYCTIFADLFYTKFSLLENIVLRHRPLVRQPDNTKTSAGRTSDLDDFQEDCIKFCKLYDSPILQFVTLAVKKFCNIYINFKYFQIKIPCTGLTAQSSFGN